MLISYKPLPTRIQPSLYNQARALCDGRVTVVSKDSEIVNMNMNPIHEDVEVLQSMNALDYDESRDRSVRVTLSKSCLSIDKNGETTSLPMSVDASHCVLSPLCPCSDYPEGSSLLTVFGDLAVLSFILSGKEVIPVEPLSLASRCSVLDVNNTLLCTPLADGSVTIWQLENRQWHSIGVFAVNTLRITGVSIARYPTIVLTTWEGGMIVEDWAAATASQRAVALPHRKSELGIGDCCGSFVLYDTTSRVFVVSRSISQELFLLDETLSTVLLYAHFDTFFRGLALSASCVYGFTNCGVYSFFLPSVEWTTLCPIHEARITRTDTSSCLSGCAMRHVIHQRVGAVEVEIHANHIRVCRDDSWRVVYLRKKVLAACLLSEEEILIANGTEGFVVSTESLKKVASCELQEKRIHDMEIVQTGRGEIYLVFDWVNEQRRALCSYQRVLIHRAGDEVHMELLPPRLIPTPAGNERRMLVDVRDNTPVFA